MYRNSTSLAQLVREVQWGLLGNRVLDLPFPNYCQKGAFLSLTSPSRNLVRLTPRARFKVKNEYPVVGVLLQILLCRGHALHIYSIRSSEIKQLTICD